MLLLCSANSVAAAELSADSTKLDIEHTIGMPAKSAARKNFTDSRLYKMTFVGVPLIATGLAMRGEDTHFRGLRNYYMKEFHRPYDNYTQYLPALAMFGMKAAGVKSRDSWGRMLASSALSAAIMGTAVNTVKHTTNVTRPDGSDNHSFPSGHTATAFMTATMLTKEYGHISPWIGIGAYTIATGTGMMRVANNKHWLSDVFAGAGVGIISTELGYYLADIIFKDKGITHFADNETFSRSDRPSFVSVCFGANIPLSCYDINEDIEFRTSTGCSAGIEGAYFFNPYLGVGGLLKAATTHIMVNGTNAEDNSAEAVLMEIGPYFSYPITSRWLIGSKLTAGYVGYSKFKLGDGSTIPANGGACLGSGLSLGYKAHERYCIRFFLDYNLMQPQSRHSGEWMSTMTIGTAFGISL